MRIRRCTNEVDLRACLEDEASEILPLCFTDAEQDWIARTIDPELARLEVHGERSYAGPEGASASADFVFTTSRGPEWLLAQRYAAITGRRLLQAEGPADRSVFSGLTPHSLTWFYPLDGNDIARSLEVLCSALEAELGHMPRLGVLTAESVAKLTWLVAKQFVIPDERHANTTLVSMKPADTRLESRVTLVGTEHTVAQVIDGFNEARGTLLLSAHSRPHCGIVKAQDVMVGLCGIASGGRGGRCVNGTACHFGEAPRVVLQDLQAQRVFFNGCTTAGVGSRRRDFLPREATISHAILRGAVREFIGNVRVGQFGESELDWFIGASALGYTPAECIEIVEVARKAVGREILRALLYFGDATNPAWPVDGVIVGEATVEDGGVQIRWPRVERVLIARVPGRTWAHLATGDRLYATTQNPLRCSVSVIADPWDDASLVLAVPNIADQDEASDLASAAPVVELRTLDEPVQRSLDGVLASALEHIRWIATLPAFAEPLANAPEQLEEELVSLGRGIATRTDQAMLPELIEYARAREYAAARHFDSVIIDEALTRSKIYWNWQREYSDRVRSTPRERGTSCPICGGFANDADVLDYANPRITRTTRICGYCGIVLDLPVWPLRAHIDIDALTHTANRAWGRVEITNDGDRLRQATLAVTVEGAGDIRPESDIKCEVTLDPGETMSFDFTLIAEAPLSKHMLIRLYIASEGAFGVVAAFVLFGQKSAVSAGAALDAQATP